jgi:DNA adenine methylase
MTALTPPLKWHGGKHYLAKQIIDLMPPHLHYVEPYFGGGSVLLAKDPEGVSEVANDINLELTNFWGLLQAPVLYESLHRLLAATPFSEIEYGMAGANDPDSPRLRRAADFFIRARQSLAGRTAGFATLSRNRTRRGMNEQASAWLTAIEGLPAVHERLKRVVILSQYALDVIRKQDGPETLFYCDPPYLHETRAAKEVYKHEMSEDDHGELLETLSTIEGKFLLSGYRSELYDDWAHSCGWRRVEFTLPNNAAGGKSKRRMTECVWMNY